MFTVNDLKFGIQFDSSDVKVSFELLNSQWDGSYFQNQTINYAFNASTKDILLNQPIFSNAINIWGAYSNVNFNFDSSNSYDLIVYEADTNDNLPNRVVSEAIGRTYWFDFVGSAYSSAEIAIDNSVNLNSYLGFYTALHELGHALGLKGDADLPEGVTSDQTVMSFNIAAGDRYAVTPMAYDIAAIADLYGAPSYNPRDLYSSETFTGGKRALTVLDTGTTKDTFNFSGVAGNHTINLNEAIDANDAWQNAATIVNGQEYVYIARGTVIENAIGGGGDDVIIGNAAANRLEGGAGFDIYQLGSAAGKDRIIDSDGAGRILIDGAILQGTASAVEGNSNRWTLAANDNHPMPHLARVG